MRNIVLLIILSVFFFTGCKTIRPAVKLNSGETRQQLPAADLPQQAVNYSDQSTWLLGYLNPSQFLRLPHSEWYVKGYDSYKPGQEAMDKLGTISKEGLEITIVMGTWCPDSRREVPRFIRIIDLWAFPLENITFIGVDNTKLAPVGGYDTLDIERVPTFIFLKNKVEAGRIIENPETSLEQDIVNILTRNEK